MFDVLLGFVEYCNQVVDKDVGQLFCVYRGGHSECGVEEVKENWFVLKGGNIKGSILLHRDVAPFSRLQSQSFLIQEKLPLLYENL